MSMVGQLSRVMVFACCLVTVAFAVAQDKPTAKATKAPAPKQAAPASPEAKEFEALFQSRVALGEKLEKLRGEITAAVKAKDQKKQQALIDQFNGMVTDF